MTEVIIALTLAYVAVAALLLNLNLATDWSPWVKGAAVAAVSALYISVWYGYAGLLGWATPDPLPEQFRVNWITLDNPDKATGEPGAIYFWVRELDEAGFPIGAPRAHKIPWDEASAEAAEQALARIDDGELLNGRLSPDALAAEQLAVDGAEYAGESVSGDGGMRPAFEFSRAPPPSLPPKATAETSDGPHVSPVTR